MLPRPVRLPVDDLPLPRRLGVFVLAALPGEHLRLPLPHVLLLLAHRYRMHLVPRRNDVHRLNALQGFESNPSFQIGTVLTSFRGHANRFRILG